MKPTHTHKTQGGRFALVANHAGGGALEGQQLVAYHDLDRDLPSVTTLEDWSAHWQPITPDTCTVCMGTGRDAIKGNKANPCGGCYGLGRVREDGETPADPWELADVAGRVIAELREEMAKIERKAALMMRAPGVAEWLEAEKARRQQAASDGQAEQERRWREGRGHGPGGARYTGD